MSIDRSHYHAPLVAPPAGRSSLSLGAEAVAQRVAGRGAWLSTSHEAIDRVIATMRERLDEPLTLQDMAAIAQLSPSHFNRSFRSLVGIPPVKFQAALRMQAAKRLLVTTDISVTEICFMVGYNSVGTFTTSFTELVGLSPSQLRTLTRLPCMDDVRSFEPGLRWPTSEAANPGGGIVQGTLAVPKLFRGLILVGLFDAPIPEHQPVACAIATETRSYQIEHVPRGTYYVLVAAFTPASAELAELMQDTPALVGIARTPITSAASRAPISADVRLRPAQSIDPPILVALASLFHQRFKQLRGDALPAERNETAA